MKPKNQRLVLVAAAAVALLAAVTLLRMRAELAEAKVEARVRRAAAE